MARLSHTIVLLSALITPFIPLTNGHKKGFADPNQPHHPNYDKRQLALCPVPCGQGWCCLTGQKCTPISNSESNSNPFECDDPVLQTTWEAFQGGYVSSLVADVSSLGEDVSRLISSLESMYSTTFDLTITPTTSTTSPNQGSGPITLGVWPTKTASTTATSTNNAAVRAGGGFKLWDRVGILGSLLAVLGVFLAV